MNKQNYICENSGYQLYRNNAGFIEGFKSKGKIKVDNHGNIIAQDIERIITTTTDPSDFPRFLNKKKKPKAYDPYQDENQLRIE